MVLGRGEAMRRREFISVMGGAAIWPLSGEAQAQGTRRIGSMSSIAEDDPVAQARLNAFREGFTKLGWVEGRNIEIEYRFAGGSPEEMLANAAELASLKPEVILVNGAPALAALTKATKSIPTVFVAVSDPVDDGFVQSMAHPGGNVTGFTDYESTTSAKWVQIPIVVASTPSNPSTPRRVRAIEAAAARFSLHVSSLSVPNAGDVKLSNSETNAGLIALPSPYTPSQRSALIQFSSENNVPAVFPFRYFVTGGGLLSYGVDVIDLYREAASYVSRILKGERPADLPVQEPTKYELIINLKTAKALGIDVPAPLLVRADEVIE